MLAWLLSSTRRRVACCSGWTPCNHSYGCSLDSLAIRLGGPYGRALPAHGPARAGAGASVCRDDDVSRDGDGVLVGEGEGGDKGLRPMKPVYVLCTGSVNVNVEPTPSSLLTRIRPPWSSTNFRHSVSPSPVPSTFLSAVPTCRNSSNTASWSSGAMPTPVSLTDTSTNPSFGPAATSIRPLSGVNLIAFDSRFKTTWRTFRSSA